MRFFRPPPGVFVRVERLEILESLPQIFEYFINNQNLQVGKPIPEFRNSWERIGYYALHCHDMAELEEVIAKVEREVLFITE